MNVPESAERQWIGSGRIVGPAPQPRQNSQVDEWVGILESTIKAAHNSGLDLVGRLGPVLTIGPEGTGSAQNDPELVPLAARIREANKNLVQLNALLCSAMARLEL